MNHLSEDEKTAFTTWVIKWAMAESAALMLVVALWFTVFDQALRPLLVLGGTVIVISMVIFWRKFASLPRN